MGTIKIEKENYLEYLIEKQNSDGKKIIEIKDGITSFTILDNTILKGASEVIIPDSVTTFICHMPEELENVKLSNNLTKIDWNTFSGCKNLKDIIIPDSVESIGESAFKDCSSLENVRLPQKLLKIDREAFSGCSNLTDLVLPDSLEKIGGLAFWKCYK